MNYSDLSSNEQRLQIAAYGFEKIVRLDYYDVRKAIEAEDVAAEAFYGSEKAKGVLAFAVFVKAAKMARLKPHHILRWIGRAWGGERAIAEYAQRELGMVKTSSARKAA